MHQSSYHRMVEFVQRYLAEHSDRPLRALDVGSYDVNGTYRPLFDKPQWSYVGMDLEPGPGVDVVAHDPFRWATLPTSSFDVVISGQAFEHIEFPWVTILEVERVLRPGGLCCLVVPSSGPEHRYPVDCWRFYPDGLVALAHWADLNVISAETHWADEGWGEEGDQWHDSVLVASKPRQKPSIPAWGKRHVLRKVMSFQAARRTRRPLPAQQ